MPIKRLDDVQSQQSWGKQKRTNEFRLYALPVFHPNVALDLTGHQIINVAYTEDTGVPLMEVEWVQGRLLAIEEVEAQRIKNITATLKYPHALWTFVDGMLEFSRQRDCWALLRVPDCPEPCEQRFTYYSTIWGEEREIGVFVGFSDNGQVIDREAPLTMPKFYTQWILNSVNVVTGFVPLNGVSFVVSGCPGGCSCDPLLTVYAVGGDGVTPTLYKSDDGLQSLATATVIALNGTNPLAAGDDPTEIWTNANIILIPYANDSSPLVAVSGGIIWSVDGVVFNQAVDDTGAALTDPFFFIEYANGRWIAGGGNGALYESFTGRTWFVIPNSLTATSVLVHGIYDKKTTTFYIAGFDGAAGLAIEIAGDSLITTITAEVAPPGRLYSVHRLGDDHIAFGGEYGYLAESFKASERDYDGSEFGAGVGNILKAMAGTSIYFIFAIDNLLYHRLILTEMDITSLTLTGVTIIGDVEDMAVANHPERGYIKRIRAVTSDGEVISFETCQPDLCDYLRVEGTGVGLT